MTATLESIKAEADAQPGLVMDRIRVPGPVAAEAIGKRFGDWEVLSWIPTAERSKPSSNVMVRCHGCGTDHEVALHNVRNGRSTRCKRCACRANRLSDPRSTAAMVVAGAIKHLPKLADDQLELLLQAVLAERDGRTF